MNHGYAAAILDLTRRNPKLHQREIARRVGCSPSNVSLTVKRYSIKMPNFYIKPSRKFMTEADVRRIVTDMLSGGR